jgi:hypothetical protein
MSSTATTTITDANDGLQMVLSMPVVQVPLTPEQQAALKGATLPPELIKWQPSGALSVTLKDTNTGCSVEVPPDSAAFKALQAFHQTGTFPDAKPGDKEMLAIQQVVRTSGAGGLFFGLGIMGGESNRTITGPENNLPGDLSGLAHLVKDCNAPSR